jgi:ABC-type lipoprotein release transport system permease subunit
MWKLAWRNLWRNRTRTLILVSAVALTYGMSLVWIGMSDEIHGDMAEAAVKTAGGSVLIHGDGYWDTRSNELLVERPAEVTEAVTAVEGVNSVTPRVLLQGLLNSARNSNPVQLTGLPPEKGASIHDVEDWVVEGSWPESPHDAPIALGKGIVESLEIQLGDKVVMTATAPDGELTRALFRLGAILDTGSKSLNESAAYTTLDVAQKVMGLGDRVTQLGVTIDDDLDEAKMAERIRTAIGENSKADMDGMEVLTWKTAMPEMVGAIELDDAMMYVYLVVIFLIVTFAIANTFLMSVMERVREFGLFNALGLNDRRIAIMVLEETVLLATLSIVSGFVLGFSGHLIIQQVGIDMASIMGQDLEMAGVQLVDMVITSELNPGKWLMATGFVFVVIVLSALYPAWRASKLAPAEAMEFYE